MTDKDIAKALNAEAKRTGGQYKRGHILVIDGMGYSVPSERPYVGFNHGGLRLADGTYRRTIVPRVSADEVGRRRVRLARGVASCCCPDCSSVPS